MWKRNQSMMAELAKKKFINKVIFVNPIISIWRLFLLKNGNNGSIFKIPRKYFANRISSKIFLYSPIYIIPYRNYFYLLKKIETRILAKICLKIITRLSSDKPYILFMNNPNAFSHDLIDNLLKCASLSIFDFSDDFLELGFSREKIEIFKHNITKYTSAADIVITVNDHIRLKYRLLEPKYIRYPKRDQLF